MLARCDFPREARLATQETTTFQHRIAPCPRGRAARQFSTKRRSETAAIRNGKLPHAREKPRPPDARTGSFAEIGHPVLPRMHDTQNIQPAIFDPIDDEMGTGAVTLAPADEFQAVRAPFPNVGQAGTCCRQSPGYSFQPDQPTRCARCNPIWHPGRLMRRGTVDIQ